ncbi:MAG: metallophosphoesterase [Candidatus Saccharicenans sp.]|uniref:metallophosphoesterase n=1 Tax=Candidatus Saccharicenans sp. TaxID=2819258 RepID=UPI0040498400
MEFCFRKKPSPTAVFWLWFLLFWLIPASLSAQEIPCVWSEVSRIVVVGDLHGDYENFVKILKGTKLVDPDLNWAAGQTFLVQMGDVMDRGPDARKIFDLIKKLEPQAAEAGGQVQMLIGNHEEMNITGIAFDYEDYVTVEQFQSFLPDDYRLRKQKELEKKARRGRSIQKLWRELIQMDQEARNKYLVNFNKKYGKWILQHNAVIKVNDLVLVHGGISEEFSRWKLEEINQRLRQELAVFQKVLLNGTVPGKLKFEVVYNSNGPLWYRQLALPNGNIIEDQVDRILANLEARHLVVAHTPHLVLTLSDMKRFDGKVWVVDTGISRAYGGYLRALVINEGQFSLWGVDDAKK